MRSNNKKIVITVYILVLSFVLLIVASQAWMNISQMPSLSEFTMNVITDNKLEIAEDEDGKPGDWETKIYFLDLPEGSCLKPVTFSATKGEFYAPRYGWDGRTDFSNPILLSDITGERPESITAEELNGYMFVSTFWLKSEWSDSQVSLAPAGSTFQDAPGNGTFVCNEPIWDVKDVCHKYNESGADSAVRFAFYLHPTEDQPDGAFVIYEPNYDGGRGENTTTSLFYDELNGNTYEGKYPLIKQHKTTFEENDPVLHGTVKYVPGEFEGSSDLFLLKWQVEYKITMFMWLEGQDADCTNMVSGTSVLMNLEFFSEVKGRYYGPNGDKEDE